MEKPSRLGIGHIILAGILNPFLLGPGEVPKPWMELFV